MEHKRKNLPLVELSVRQLRARRRRLARQLEHAEVTLRGSLRTQGRRCGKEGCRCAQGELHGPYVYVSVRGEGGRRRLLYVPADWMEAVRACIERTEQMEAALDEISRINLELLTRRALD
jgi:transposase